jgi:uncharacterized protein (DUF433 family)
MGLSELSLLKSGIYSLPRAARLLGISTQQIRRWMVGRVVFDHNGERVIPPLWEPHLPIVDGKVALSFLDLMELRLVKALVEHHGLRLPKIRACIGGWRSLNSEYPYPLLNRKVRLMSDGNTLIARLSDHSSPLDLSLMQYLMTEVIEPNLVDLDFDGQELPLRWWPLGRKAKVLISPLIEFGEPIIRDTGIPTQALAEAVKAEGSERKVAQIYGVSVDVVRSAVDFERGLHTDRAKAA